MRTNSVKILVVDDDPDTGEVMRFLLAKEGFLVEMTTSPRAALDMLRENQFHILILDLVMPEMSGIEVLERVRQSDKDLAVIVVTGYPSVETAVASLKGGVCDYVSKPVEKEKLIGAVKAVVDDKGLLRNPDEKLLVTVGARIRTCRKDQDLTLKQVARRTGLSVSLLSQIERAESAASVASLYRITSALQTDMQSIFEGF